MTTRKRAPSGPRPPKQRKYRVREYIARYVLVTTQSRRENWARLNCHKQGMRTVWPRIENPLNGHLEPMFPGYLFVEYDRSLVHRLRGTFGVVSLVPSWERMEYVPYRFMEMLLGTLNDEQYVEAPERVALHEGDSVEIAKGSWKGFAGVISHRDGLQRNRVMFEFMGKLVEKEFKRSELTPRITS